jgi:hypothetical protein
MLVGKAIDFPFPRLKLSNGTTVHARGANSPQYIRGNHAHLVIVDEACFVKEAALTDVIEPMFTVTGKELDSAQINTSTPFGEGYVKDAFDLGEKHVEDYASFHFTSFDNPHADVKFLERQRERYGEDSILWRTEYMGLWADSDLAVFPWADIKWATEHYPDDLDFPVAPERGHRYVQGADLANMRDYFVASVLDATNPTFAYLARMDRYQKRGYAAVKSTIRSNHHSYNGARTLIDATTLAESVVEDLSDIGAEGYAFSGSQAKWEVVQELARALSEHRLGIPPDRDVINELRYFEYKLTAAKNIKMEARKGHDDIVMSLALASRLAFQGRQVAFFGLANAPAARQSVVPAHHAFHHPRPTPPPPTTDPWANLWAFDEE